MATDYSLRWDVLDSINDLADKVIELLEDKFPYFMVFAVKNENYKTEYKTFYLQASEIGAQLTKDKFPKILKLFDIPLDGTPAEKKTWSMSKELSENLDHQLDLLRYKCKSSRVSLFVMIAAGNTEKNTDYLMRLASPFECMVSLYDDRITKVLRYTNDPNNFPGQNNELPDDIDQFDELTQDLIIDSDALDMTVDQYDELIVQTNDQANDQIENQTDVTETNTVDTTEPVDATEVANQDDVSLIESEGRAPEIKTAPKKRRKKKVKVEPVEITVENVDQVFPDDLDII